MKNKNREHVYPLNPTTKKFRRRSRKVSAMEAKILPVDDGMSESSTLALLDSGCTSSMVHHSLIPKTYWRKLKRTVHFTTKSSGFNVQYKAEIEVKLPELSSSKTFKWSFYIDQSKDNQIYNMFIGSDILETLGIDLNYSTKTIQWEDSFAPMRSAIPKHKSEINSDNEKSSITNEMDAQIRTDLNNPDASAHAKASASRATEILDASYEKADLNKIVDNISTINIGERKKLLKMLTKYESLFDGTLGDFNWYREYIATL